MTNILPPITSNDVGKVPISDNTLTYNAFVDNAFYNSPYDIRQGYIEFVGSDGQIRFVKRLDNTRTFVSTIYSYGIVSGLQVQPITGNTVKITAGKAYFSSGMKDLAEQNVPIPGGTPTIYYIFVDASNTIEISQIYDPDPTQLTLGCVYTNGTAITEVYLNRRDSLDTAIDNFCNLLKELGYYYSGFQLSYNPTLSALSIGSGVVHDAQYSNKKWPSAPKASLQKVYYGNVFGESSDKIDIDFLKVISIPSGEPSPVIQNSSVFHFIYVNRSTGKFYLLISDHSIPLPVGQVTIPDLIGVVNKVKSSRFLDGHCVLVGAIGVYFNATTNAQIRLIQIHKGLSGARGVGSGVYPSPYAYAGGGILASRVGEYYIYQPVDSYILDFAASHKAGKYIPVVDKSKPSLVDMKEYGAVGKGKLIAFIDFAPLYLVAGKEAHREYYLTFSSYEFFYKGLDGYPNSDGEAFNYKFVVRYTNAFGINTLNARYTLGNGIAGTSPVIYGYSSALSAGTNNNIPPINYKNYLGISVHMVATVSINSSSAYKHAPYDEVFRTSKMIAPPGFYVYFRLNNFQPSSTKNIFTADDPYRPVPSTRKLIVSDSLRIKIRAKIGELFNVRGDDNKFQRYSIMPIYSISRVFANGESYFCERYALNFGDNDDNPPILGIQPNDVAHLDSPIMTDDELDFFVASLCSAAGYNFMADSATAFEDVAKYLGNNLRPYFNNNFTIKYVYHPYATTPYTGAPT